MARTRFAVIDVGTNTVRLLIADADGPSAYQAVQSAQEITRLGEGAHARHELQAAPMERTLKALARFRELARATGAHEILAVGTSALREASNRDAFLARAREDLGLDVSVVSGETEARLALLGVRAALPQLAPRFLMMDIGGGSTEFVRADGDQARDVLSIGLGVVRLTEAFLSRDPPAAEELQAASRAAKDLLIGVREALAGLSAQDPLVGTAGTVTTLAAIDLALDPYDAARVTGHTLSRGRIAALLEVCATRPLARRRTLPGLEPGRADVIVAGAIICGTVMDVLGFPALTVSDGGLREGILIDWLTRRFRRAAHARCGPA
jgi:exopolyphosphatase / guanosine-5'-triphosphate,3'-diphosphate pyrophosphatase